MPFGLGDTACLALPGTDRQRVVEAIHFRYKRFQYPECRRQGFHYIADALISEGRARNGFRYQ